MSRLTILLSVEFINRELDSCLFLGVRFASPHNRILIGHDDLTHKMLPDLRGGLYVGRNVHRPRFPDVDQTLYRTLKESGLIFVHLDEEGAVHPGDEDSWQRVLQRRLDPNCLQADDAICTWGDWQRDTYRASNPPCSEHIETTGHPRFDLYREEYREYFAPETEAIRERYGDFILINTNLFRANNRCGLNDTFSAKRGFDATQSERLTEHVAHFGYHRRVLSRFIELTAFLSRELPKFNIVLRPHPSENFDFYRTIFHDVPNVHVVHEGSVTPWLLATRCLIHDGCTTAIEAHLAGTPIINYKAEEEERFDKFLPNIFGDRCHSEEEVLRALQSIFENGKSRSPEIPERALKLFSNFQSPAFPRLEAVMTKATERVAHFDDAPAKLLRGDSMGRKMTKLIRRARKRDSRFHPQFGLRQFYGFEHCNVEEKLDRIQKMLGKKVNSRVVSSELICIEG